MSFQFAENQARYAVGEIEHDAYNIRMHRALYATPVYPLLFNEVTGLNSEFTEALQNVNEVTRQNGICDHGWSHIVQVARNAMLLTDVARTASKTMSSNGSIEDISQSDILSDGMILFTAMHSDLAYGDSGANVTGRSVFDHAIRSTARINKYHTIDPTSDTYDATRLIRSNSPTLNEALSIDIDGAIDYAAQTYSQEEPVSAQQLFVVIHKLADVLDYYRADRVANIRQSDQSNNPYFHLAKKVKYYTISFDGSLVYRANMDTEHIGVSQSGEPIESFTDWYQASRVTVDADRKNYDQVWQLADLYSAILGFSFKVEELK